jgi:hypothetical protein
LCVLWSWRQFCSQVCNLRQTCTHGYYRVLME